MVLDLDRFRSEKGHNPDEIVRNQKLRFKDVALVETVIAQDSEWRSCRHRADNWNKLKNACSKVIGDKLKAKEPQGDAAAEVPAELVAGLAEIGGAEQLRPLTVAQIKKIRVLIDAAVVENDRQLEVAERTRNTALREVGNHLHESVPVSNDEEENRVERTFGDCEQRGRYSHVDLIHMIDGMNGDKGAVISGGRGYFLTGPAVFLEHALIQYALHSLHKKGYTPLYTPFFMRKDVSRCFWKTCAKPAQVLLFV